MKKQRRGSPCRGLRSLGERSVLMPTDQGGRRGSGQHHQMPGDSDEGEKEPSVLSLVSADALSGRGHDRTGRLQSKWVSGEITVRGPWRSLSSSP